MPVSKLCAALLSSFCLLSLVFCLLSYAEDKASSYQTKNKRNPFIPLVTQDGRLINLEKEGAKADLLLEGIVFDKYGRSYAIVNGTVAEVGDTIAGFRVLKIEQVKVTFIKDGKTRAVEIKNKEEGK